MDNTPRRPIHQEILKGDGADYGKQILATLSQELTKLPPREVLVQELHKAIILARERFALQKQLKTEVDE